MIFYNVLIGGTSVGMTPHIHEAQAWVGQSTYKGEKRIVITKQKN